MMMTMTMMKRVDHHDYPHNHHNNHHHHSYNYYHRHQHQPYQQLHHQTRLRSPSVGSPNGGSNSGNGWAVGGDEWEAFRTTIQDLYQGQNLSLKEVMRIMEDRHGFRATQRMYKTRIKSWGLDKNFKESEVVELFRLRRDRERAGKVQGVYMIRGREVDWDRVHSYIRRKGLDINRLVETTSMGPSAREISCRTPSPPPTLLPPPTTTAATTTAASAASSAALVPGLFSSLSHHSMVMTPPQLPSPTPSPPSLAQQYHQPIHPLPPAAIATAAAAIGSMAAMTTTSSSSIPSTAAAPLSPMLFPPITATSAASLYSSPYTTAYGTHTSTYPPPPTVTTSTTTPLCAPATTTTTPTSTMATTTTGSATTTTIPLSTFQSFLASAYRTLLREDSQKTWGTTEYWLRSTRSQEWLSALRYKLAVHRDHLSSPTPSKRVRRYRAYNRAFACLEGGAGYHEIGARGWYFVNFVASFLEMTEEPERGMWAGAKPFYLDYLVGSGGGGNVDDDDDDDMMDGYEEEEVGVTQEDDGDLHMGMGRRKRRRKENPFAELASRLVNGIGAIPGLRNGEGSGTLGATTTEDDQLQQQQQSQQTYPYYSPSAGLFGATRTTDRTPTFADPRTGFRKSSKRFLTATLQEIMSRELGVLTIPVDALLLLEEDAEGYPILPASSSSLLTTTRLPTIPLYGTTATNTNNTSSWRNCLPSPTNTAAPATKETLETAIRLLARHEDAKAEGYLQSLVAAAGAAGVIPGVTSSRETRVLGRLAGYHLSRIYRRRGQAGMARECLMRTVEGSLLCDEYVSWDEAEFMFA